ncbi:50S ribosomal protein L25/general stress protein Ctc [Thiomicrospira microaerophila]|uniref:50S ribosomal protein L25/general stress protein Ctc n=1 Tax=Thiomicrospira microaerophila TaxID=406020 RepID=UPI00200DE1B6|nr:50S ribosomal protein L25/general stress protein Ctc [Thiomicrospira microaerophila]UQB42768.1 50S ribosomal protein L25/general stress protein Ctc [Thiomicrospira microaerophila]
MSEVWTAEARGAEGKGASRRLRHAGKVPGIIYGANKDAISVTFDANFVKKALVNIDAYNSVLTVDVKGGDQERVVIKDMQRHPARADVMHLDLQRVNDDSRITKHVPIKFVGAAKAPGVKLGGMMTFFQKTVELRCAAKDLPKAVEIDVSAMEAGENLRLSDLKMPEGVQVVALLHGNSDYDQAVVGIGKVRR